MLRGRKLLVWITADLLQIDGLGWAGERDLRVTFGQAREATKAGGFERLFVALVVGVSRTCRGSCLLSPAHAGLLRYDLVRLVRLGFHSFFFCVNDGPDILVQSHGKGRLPHRGQELAVLDVAHPELDLRAAGAQLEAHGPAQARLVDADQLVRDHRGHGSGRDPQVSGRNVSGLDHATGLRVDLPAHAVRRIVFEGHLASHLSLSSRSRPCAVECGCLCCLLVGGHRRTGVCLWRRT
mmetsp:Transcript_33690/g.65571  ORF Transcript_33690/g.65571 Transcript_33690/m.65571 type:complete len:238 (+) Transcript_33690:420-1133(+)